MNFNSQGIFVSKTVKFEVVFFDWPFIFLQAKAKQNNLRKLVFFDLWIPDSGFWIPVLDSGFRFQIPVSSFWVAHIYQLEYVSLFRWVSTREVALYIAFFKAQWCDHKSVFKHTAKNLVAYVTSWLLTLSPGP